MADRGQPPWPAKWNSRRRGPALQVTKSEPVILDQGGSGKRPLFAQSHWHWPPGPARGHCRFGPIQCLSSGSA